MPAPTIPDHIGPYEVLGPLGRGASAAVFRCLHPALQREVAVKRLHPERARDRAFTRDFLQEARLLASLDHANVVRVFDACGGPDDWYVVMELFAGQEIADVIAARGPLPCAEVSALLRQVAAALAHSHERGIAHLDVKPHNCVVDDGGHVKLMDFGLARRFSADEAPGRTPMVDGTPKYLAPEAAMGLVLDGRADVYSLGVMAFELLTGRVPFDSDSIRVLLQMHARMPAPDLRALRPDVTDALAEFVAGALIKDRTARLVDPATIQELLA
mgnify:CR=1 FL=1